MGELRLLLHSITNEFTSSFITLPLSSASLCWNNIIIKTNIHSSPETTPELLRPLSRSEKKRCSIWATELFFSTRTLSSVLWARTVGFKVLFFFSFNQRLQQPIKDFKTIQEKVDVFPETLAVSPKIASILCLFLPWWVMIWKVSKGEGDMSGCCSLYWITIPRRTKSEGACLGFYVSISDLLGDMWLFFLFFSSLPL